MSTWSTSCVLSLFLGISGGEARAQEGTNSGHAGSYVIVLDRSPEAAGFEKVARELAEFRAAETIIDLRDEADDGGGLDGVFDALYAMAPAPAHVAFVVGPHRIEDTFVGRVFERATRFDDKPYLDIAYGFITAATPDGALELVRSTRRAEEDRPSINRKFVAVGHTFRESDLGMFALQQQAHMKQFGYVSEAINPIDDCAQWSGRTRDEMQKLNGASLVFFAGHGMGDWLCGVDAEDYTGFTLDRAVVVNGACHSVSMLLRHDLAPATMTVLATSIPAERSIALRLIEAGAIAQIGSTASSAWMNVAYAIPEFFHSARTVGDALRRGLNTHIARENIREITILDFEVGKPNPQFLGPDKNPGHVQSIARVVLIGDPAYRPQPEPLPMREIPHILARPHPMGEPPDPWAGREMPVEPTSLGDMIDALVRGIDDHFITLNRVINVGAPAVEPLLERLEAMHSVRGWQVPKALGAIRDKRAIDALIDALERVPHVPFSDVVVEALEWITGEQAGTTAKQWRAWREKSGS